MSCRLDGRLYISVGFGAGNIFVQNKPGFVREVSDQLRTIASKPIGQRLLRKIADASHKIYIEAGNTDRCVFLDREVVFREAGYPRKTGCGSRVILSINNYEGTSRFLERVPLPRFLVLAHELIHAYHNAAGNNYNQRTDLDIPEIWTDAEEYHTIMDFPSKNPNRDPSRPKITANSIAKEHELPEVFSHLGYSGNPSPLLRCSALAQRVAESVKEFFRWPGFDSVIPPVVRIASAPFEKASGFVQKAVGLRV